MQLLAIVQPHMESAPIQRDLGYGAAIQLRHGPLLEPVAIADKVFDRHRLGGRKTVQLAIAREAQSPLWVRKVRSLGSGAQEHATRHVTLPELHGVAEDPHFHVSGAQMCGGTEPIRPGADNCDLAV